MNADKPLADAMLALLAGGAGLTARDLAAELDLERQQVNALLYGQLSGKVWQDKDYRWHLLDKSAAVIAPKNAAASGAATPLARLCRYYLACLAQDSQDNLSVFASGRHGLDYVQLDALPGSVEGEALFASEEAGALLRKMRLDKGRLGLYLGYPIHLRRQRGRNNWEGFFVEPVLVLPFEFDAKQPGSPPVLSGDYPAVNMTALKGMRLDASGDLMTEVVQLEEELGLNLPPDELPDLDEIARRLQAIRPEWPWREPIDPEHLASEPPPAAIDEPGIYNRAVLFVAERSPYTQGLEAELSELAGRDGDAARGTALGQWCAGGVHRMPVAQNTPTTLLEVLPMNLEQREAIRRALTEPLTVITGPPGTGKSQVVTNLLVNAAYRRQRVLFASKNNKAVDVVETRVNELGQRPLLLRVGRNEYQQRLGEYLTELLAARASAGDQQAFTEHRARHADLITKFADLEKDRDEVVALRNRVDAVEQEIEALRGTFGPERFATLPTAALEPMRESVGVLQAALREADWQTQGWFTRLLWPLLRRERFERVQRETQASAAALTTLGIAPPGRPPDDLTMALWTALGPAIVERLGCAAKVQGYFSALADLQARPRLEELAAQETSLLQGIAVNSARLWDAWMRLQPNRLSQSDRSLLGKYAALVRMLTQVGDGQKADRKTWAEYYRMMPAVSHLLPCWAVTSLSARGKIPFDAGMFDLVVFDEASQCDIASAVPLLYRAKRVVVIGDPKQLPHISAIKPHQDQQLLSRFDLLRTHAEWAYATQSLFGLAQSLCRPEDIVVLRDHHRSHAEIIDFSNEEFYRGELRVATRYDRLRPIDAGDAAVRWIQVRGRAERPPTGGARNVEEARAVVEELRRLVLDRGYAGTVGVVSPFRAQANLIRELVTGDDVLATRLAHLDFLVDTVHKFQGDERDVMVFSPVVSAGTPAGAIGFLRGNGNLFNVAITRARAALLVVGDKVAASTCGVAYLEHFARYVDGLDDARRRREAVADTDLGPTYPIVADPSKVSEWEHVLYRALYAAGIRPIPQYAVEHYLLDFAILASDRRLNIEVDGERYHRQWNGELARRDQLRNQRMFELGWDVMRFWVYEVRDDLDGCVRRVGDWVGEACAAASPDAGQAATNQDGEAHA